MYTRTWNNTENFLQLCLFFLFLVLFTFFYDLGPTKQPCLLLTSSRQKYANRYSDFPCIKDEHSNGSCIMPLFHTKNVGRSRNALSENAAGGSIYPVLLTTTWCVLVIGCRAVHRWLVLYYLTTFFSPRLYDLVSHGKTVVRLCLSMLYLELGNYCSTNGAFIPTEKWGLGQLASVQLAQESGANQSVPCIFVAWSQSVLQAAALKWLCKWGKSYISWI